MHKTTLYLPPALRRAVKEAARRTRRSQADIVREALEQYTRSLKGPWPRSIGLGVGPDLTARESERWLTACWRVPR